jgi:hypothetical protein
VGVLCVVSACFPFVGFLGGRGVTKVTPGVVSRPGWVGHNWEDNLEGEGAMGEGNGSFCAVRCCLAVADQ